MLAAAGLLAQIYAVYRGVRGELDFGLPAQSVLEDSQCTWARYYHQCRR